MCIIGSLYIQLRKNSHLNDLYEYSIRNGSDELARTLQVDDDCDLDSDEDFREQLKSDVRILTQIRQNGNRLRDEILSYVP